MPTDAEFVVRLPKPNLTKAFYEPDSDILSKLSSSWCASYSGGKDSTSLITWIEWLRRTKQITVERPQLVQSDTTVEYPELQALSREMMTLMRRCGWECAVVEPMIHQKLYNRILGIGNTPIHPGGRNMRWCTRSTKIDPMKKWRKANSSGFTLTGVRRGESGIRDDKLRRRDEKRKGCSAGGECGLPDVDDNTIAPIIHWTTCNVWEWLCGDDLPKFIPLMRDVFAISKRLYEIYEVTRGQDTFGWDGPTYTSARFGCIGCPAIQSERYAPKSSIARHGESSPLNELYGVWFEARRRDNRCIRNHDGKDGRGPIKMEIRKVLFARVMDIQRRAGIVLITPEDEAFIRDCWERKVYPRGWSEADELTQSNDKTIFEVHG